MEKRDRQYVSDLQAKDNAHSKAFTDLTTSYNKNIQDQADENARAM